MTATAIVAGMPIAIARIRNPSAPQSQSSSPDASSTAVGPPDPAGDQRGAPPAPDPEQPQRQRGRDDRDDEHHDDPEHARRGTETASEHHEPPVHGAPAPHSERSSVAPDLGHEGATRLECERAVGIGEERAGQRAVRTRTRRRRSRRGTGRCACCAGWAAADRHPLVAAHADLVARHLASRRRPSSRSGGNSVTSTARSPATIGVEPEARALVVDLDAAELPTGRDRRDARHAVGPTAPTGRSGSSGCWCRRSGCRRPRGRARESTGPHSPGR